MTETGQGLGTWAAVRVQPQGWAGKADETASAWAGQ